MSIKTLWKFLCGDPEAIKIVACQPYWLGILLVTSASLARNYDTVYIPGKPWILLVPFFVSTVASFLLFFLFELISNRMASKQPPFLRTYSYVLNTFWMTAPLAWLYAIPYERFFTLHIATKCNLITLAVVSLWRIILLSRVFSVLACTTLYDTQTLVILFGSGTFFFILQFTQLPLINVMGGIQLLPNEEIIASMTLLTGVVSVFVFLASLINLLIVIVRKNNIWNWLDIQKQIPPTKSMKFLSIGPLVALILVLPITQAEQMKGYEVNELLAKGNIRQALQTMSDYGESAFPPHWTPIPRPGYGDETPDLITVMEVIIENNYSPWVRNIYESKFFQTYSWNFNSDLDKLERFWRIAISIPNYKERFPEHIRYLDDLAKEMSNNPKNYNRIQALRLLIQNQ